MLRYGNLWCPTKLEMLCCYGKPAYGTKGVPQPLIGVCFVALMADSRIPYPSRLINAGNEGVFSLHKQLVRCTHRMYYKQIPSENRWICGGTNA